MYDFSPEELTIVAPAHVKEISPQNAGAGRLNRARETSRDSSTFVLAAVLLAWAALALAQDLVVRTFFAHCMTAELVHLFCSWLAAGSLFTGALFVANVPMRPSLLMARISARSVC